MRDIVIEPPDFVNDAGVKWWHEVQLTRYAACKGLPDVRVWVIERPDGVHTRLVTEGDAVLTENQTLDGIGCAINMLALKRRAL